MTRARTARWLVAAVVALAIAGLTVPAVAAQTTTVVPSDGGLRIDGTDVSAYPTVSVTLTWPAPPADAAVATPTVEVLEGGEARPARVTRLPGQGLAVALVVDTSGSMAGGAMDAAKAAAAAFVARLPADAQVAVVGFGASPYVATPLTADRAAIAAAVAGLTAQGETALYDAVGVGLDQLPAGAGTRRHLVVLSDGGDTASAIPIDAAVARLTGAGVGIDVAELATTDSNHAALERLARAGGGGVVAATDPAALTTVYEALARGLASQYEVEFDAAGRGGTPVRITLDQSGQRAEADLTLELPAPVATTGRAPTEAAAPAPAVAQPVGGPNIWLLVAGGLLCFAALLIFLAPLGRRRSTVQLNPYHVPGSSSTSTMSRLAEQVTARADQALEHGDRRSRLNEALERAGIILRPAEFVVLAASAAVGALAVGTLLANLVVGLLLAVVVVIAARLLLSVLTARRRRQFLAQLGDNLQLIAGTLRSGYGVLQALDVVAQEAEVPSRDEFRRIVVEARLGRDVNDSLSAAAQRVGGEDFAWVAQAIEINREVGGDLAVVLDNVAATIRERDRIRRQVRALSAEGKLSAYVLVALPIGLAGLIAVINPDYMVELTRGTGLLLSAVSVVMLAVGSFWLSRMVKVDY